MAGINDMEECKPTPIVMDITVDSPNLDKRELYAYWHSPFSPYSILTAAKDLYPTWTTGKVEDFSAKSGSYNAPYLTENQADTLSGVFDATFLEYPKDKAKELFERIVELVPQAPEVRDVSRKKREHVGILKKNKSQFHFLLFLTWEIPKKVLKCKINHI